MALGVGGEQMSPILSHHLLQNLTELSLLLDEGISRPGEATGLPFLSLLPRSPPRMHT